jgi:hypothetical protein
MKWTTLILMLALIGLLPAMAPGEDNAEDTGDATKAKGDKVEIPPNTWVAADLTFEKPAGIPDASWSTSDGYCGATYRAVDGTVLWRTGVRSSKVGLNPGFYSNATLAWKPGENVARVVTLSRHWGGGSYGGGKLLEGFAQNPEPTPRHTYDGITWVADQDAIYLHLGANWRIGAKNATPEAKKQHALDNKSTWKYAFKTGKWTRIDDSVRRFWASQYKVSPYESHLQYWPEGEKLLFLNDRGNHYATFDLNTQKWEQGKLKNKCPMSLYNARSIWDAKRSLWVFRLGPKLCTFDPKAATFQSLPAPYEVDPENKKDPRRATKGVAYVDKHDVYLIAGPTGNDTYAFDPGEKHWTHITGGDLKMVNGYMQYDPASNLTVMVYQHKAYRFRYVPAATSQPEKAK